MRTAFQPLALVPIPMQVLIVDDSSSDVRLMMLWLRSSDVIQGLHTVSDGQTALRYVKGEGEFVGRLRPDLVLLDSQLPDLRGLDVLAQLRRDYPATELGIILISGAYHPDDARRAIELGADEYLSKPFDADDFTVFVARLESYWEQRKRPSG